MRIYGKNTKFVEYKSWRNWWGSGDHRIFVEFKGRPADEKCVASEIESIRMEFQEQNRVEIQERN